jgi:hypothetical protein
VHEARAVGVDDRHPSHKLRLRLLVRPGLHRPRF